MMNRQWIILLFVGCAVAAPWPWSKLEPKREITDEEKREIRIRGILTDPNAPAEAKIEAVNEENDLQLSFGDLKLTPEQQVEIKEGQSNNLDKRSATHFSVDFLWARRTVPYVLHGGLASEKVTLIRQAFEIFHNQSCIKFVERTTEPYYLYFQNLTGCWSYVGFTNATRGYQEVSIGDGCEHLGVIIHEILHALGFWHEQSRPDRDSTVEILWENIKPAFENNFKKLDKSQANEATNYDTSSILHYANYAFSKNGKKTIQDINNPAKVLGQKDRMSDSDVIALDLLYSCNVTDGGWSMWTQYGPCSDDCKKIRNRFCTNAQSSAACNANYQDGKQKQITVCPDSECYKPVDGHWGKWTTWGNCSKTCGLGTKTRTRECNDPAPKHNGKNCPGSNTETGECQLKECGAGPCDCGFDDNDHKFCGWVQDPDDDKPTYKDFKRGGATPSGNTGPQNGDHTSGNGMFIYSEASDCIHTTGKFVRLLSTLFPATGSSGRCFSLWYYGFGATLGDFNVYVKTGSGETRIGGFTATELRAQSNDKKWKQAKYHFTSDQQYKIVLESKCGLDYRADLAIDDTKFTDGVCA